VSNAEFFYGRGSSRRKKRKKKGVWACGMTDGVNPALNMKVMYPGFSRDEKQEEKEKGS
jgi:hypothetical protein